MIRQSHHKQPVALAHPASSVLSWRLLRYAVARWPGLLLVMSTMFLGVGLNLLNPWPMKVLVDYALDGKPMPAAVARVIDLLPGAATRENLVAWSVAGTVLLFVMGWALGLARAYANIGFGQRMIYDLAADLFDHLQRLSLGFHSRRSVGDNLRRVTTDCGCVATIVTAALLPLLTTTFSLVTMFAVMWRMDRTLTALSLVVVPYMILVFRRYIRPMWERSAAQQEVEARIYGLVEQTLTAIPIVQAFGREEHTDQRFRSSTGATLDAALAATSIQLQFKILMGLATAVGTAGILWLGARHVLEGTLTVGGILVFLSYLSSLYGPLEALMYTSSTIQGASGSVRRVMEVLEAEPEVIDRPGALLLLRPAGLEARSSMLNARHSGRGASRAERRAPDTGLSVRLEHVTFGYDPQRPVLRDVSLLALPGQTLALVGPTGAGKSTFVSLIPRFFDPWEGRVTVGDHDVRDVQLRSLRDQVALVLQEPFLFPVSIAENIAYGRPEATPAEIEGAARAANAHAFITRLPGGYQTAVGERGATLSGGERQRIAIARALLKDAPILILDEPTSALDAETEGLLLEALERLMAGRTTFIIAHRLSTIRGADRIVVIEEGRVVEEGRHGELLGRGGLYARFHSRQFGSSTRMELR